MKVKPLSNGVVIKPTTIENKTSSGIIIPDNAKEKPQQGEVVAVGKGKVANDGLLINMSVAVGDAVLYNKYAGTEISVDGDDCLIMTENDILAIMEEN